MTILVTAGIVWGEGRRLGKVVDETERLVVAEFGSEIRMTPEALAFACTRLLELGALDVYLTPGTMKKGRPGHVLTVLCDPAREAELARLILLHTATIGLRVRRCAKYFLTPGSETAQTPWGEVRVKTAKGFGIEKRKIEFEDAAALSRAHNVPLSEVEAAALRGL